MPFHARAYRGDDLPRVTDLLEARLAAGLACNLSVAEVRQLLPRPATDTERYGRVWEDSSGRLIGFGLIRVPWDTVQLLVHPDQDSERGAAQMAFLEHPNIWVTRPDQGVSILPSLVRRLSVGVGRRDDPQESGRLNHVKPKA